MSHQSNPTMTASWTTSESANEDRTVLQCGPRNAFEDALVEGLDFGALRQAHVNRYHDSDALDASALFADLPFSSPPLAQPNAVWYASPYVAVHAPSNVAPTMTTMRRSEARTVPSRGPAARGESRQARHAAIAVCGVLALIAALAACVFYVGTSHRTDRTAASAAPL